jgi:hypothetical protein
MALYAVLWILVFAQGVITICRKLKVKRLLQEKGTCLSCKHIGDYAGEPLNTRTCWHRESVYFMSAADRKAWIIRRPCEFYEEKDR